MIVIQWFKLVPDLIRRAAVLVAVIVSTVATATTESSECSKSCVSETGIVRESIVT